MTKKISHPAIVVGLERRKHDMTLDQHFTPDYVAEYMVGLVSPNLKRALEPSAGTGILANTLVESRGITPDVIEIDPRLCLELEKNYNVVCVGIRGKFPLFTCE